jgi:hypothetical protein
MDAQRTRRSLRETWDRCLAALRGRRAIADEGWMSEAREHLRLRGLQSALRMLLIGVAFTFIPHPGGALGGLAPICLTRHIGIDSHLFNVGEGEATQQLETIHRGGIDWVREDFRWDLAEPAPGVYDWSRTDRLMAAAAKADTQVLAIIDYSAPWASSDPSGGGDKFYPPQNPSDYAEFSRQVVLRYGSGGSFWDARPHLTPNPLKAVELWNEPYSHIFWKPNPDPQAYAEMSHAAAAAIRGAQPATTIILPGDPFQTRTNSATPEWLGEVLSADPGLADLINAYSVHPYPEPRGIGPGDAGDPRFTFDRVALAHQVAVAHNAELPIWITEIGWSTADASVGGVSEATQAAYVQDSILRSFGTWPYVSHVFVYSWDESSGAPTDWEGNLGLRRMDGSLKPAWGTLVDLLATNRQTCGIRPLGSPPPSDSTGTGTGSSFEVKLRLGKGALGSLRRRGRFRTRIKSGTAAKVSIFIAVCQKGNRGLHSNPRRANPATCNPKVTIRKQVRVRPGIRHVTIRVSRRKRQAVRAFHRVKVYAVARGFPR